MKLKTFEEKTKMLVVCFLLGNTLASEIQTPGNYPEESIQHSEHGKSLK